MITYSMQFEDGSVVDIPTSIESRADAIAYVRMAYPNNGEVRLMVHTWSCVSTTPHMIETDEEDYL